MASSSEIPAATLASQPDTEGTFGINFKYGFQKSFGFISTSAITANIKPKVRRHWTTNKLCHKWHDQTHAQRAQGAHSWSPVITTSRPVLIYVLHLPARTPTEAGHAQVLCFHQHLVEHKREVLPQKLEQKKFSKETQRSSLLH